MGTWVRQGSRKVLLASIQWAFKDKLTKMDVEAFAALLTKEGGPARGKPSMPPKSFKDLLMPTPDMATPEEMLDADRHKNLVVKGEDWVTACKLYRAASTAYMELVDQDDIPQCVRDIFDIIAQYDAANGNHIGAWENSRKRLETLQDELDH